MKGEKMDDSLAAWQMTSAGVQQAFALQETILFFNRVNLKINQGVWDKSWRGENRAKKGMGYKSSSVAQNGW